MTSTTTRLERVDWGCIATSGSTEGRRALPLTYSVEPEIGRFACFPCTMPCTTWPCKRRTATADITPTYEPYSARHMCDGPMAWAVACTCSLRHVMGPLHTHASHRHAEWNMEPLACCEAVAERCAVAAIETGDATGTMYKSHPARMLPIWLKDRSTSPSSWPSALAEHPGVARSKKCSCHQLHHTARRTASNSCT